MCDKIFYLVVFIWLLFFIGGMSEKTKTSFNNISQTLKNSDNRNLELLYGEFYHQIEACNNQLPIDSTVFMLTDNLFYYYYGAYYLYPRRLLIGSPDKNVDGLTPFAAIYPEHGFIKGYNVYTILQATQDGSFSIVRTK